MDVNNNNTQINNMFNADESANSGAGSPVPAFSSPPPSSPFSSLSPDSSDSGSPGGNHNDDEPVIGDHNAFGFAPEHYSKRVSLKLMMALLPIFLIIGVAGGGFLLYTYLFGLHISPSHSAALTAANAIPKYEKEILGIVPGDYIFTGAYVKDKTTEYECVFLAIVYDSPAEYRNTSFRVIINKTNNTVTVYSEYDPDEYNRLAEGSKEERIQAEILLSYLFEYNRAIEEIRAGNNGWVEIDQNFLGVRLNR